MKILHTHRQRYDFSSPFIPIAVQAVGLKNYLPDKQQNIKVLSGSLNKIPASKCEN